MATPQQIVPDNGASQAPANAFLEQETPDAAPVLDAPEADAAPQETGEQAAEEEARAAGWVSREEWVDSHGSERGWKPASDYLDFRHNFLPIVQKENRELRAKLAAIEAREQERSRIEAEARANFERERLQADLEQAVENGDRQAVRDLTNKLFDLKIKQGVAPQQPQQQVDPELRREFEAFADRNPWLKNDRKLTRFFAAQVKTLGEQDPNMPVGEVLDEARDITRRTFPEKFARRPAMAEGNGEHGASRPRGRSWNDLTPEYREVYNAAYFKMNPEVKPENLIKHLPDSAFRSNR